MTKTQTPPVAPEVAAQRIDVEIRTDDPTFTRAGRDGRKVVTVTETGRRRVQATGYEFVRFTLDRTPSDWLNRHGCAPVEWIVS